MGYGEILQGIYRKNMNIEKFLEENSDIKQILLEENEKIKKALDVFRDSEKITEISLIAKGSTNHS